jgi:dihydrofolate reductase
MEIIIIAAVAENGIIGNRGKLPWERIPEDMQRFRDLTMGHPVIMGRTTYESIPPAHRPLEGRTNIVLSRQQSLSLDSGVHIVRSIEGAISAATTYGEEIFVAGGREVYKAALPHTNRIELTRIHEYNTRGDVLFPAVPWPSWDLVHEEHPSPHYSFLTYRKK